MSESITFRGFEVPVCPQIGWEHAYTPILHGRDFVQFGIRNDLRTYGVATVLGRSVIYDGFFDTTLLLIGKNEPYDNDSAEEMLETYLDSVIKNKITDYYEAEIPQWKLFRLQRQTKIAEEITKVRKQRVK